MGNRFCLRIRYINKRLIVFMIVVFISACSNTQKADQPASGSGDNKADGAKQLTVKDIYNGADRDQLEKKAKEEGKVLLYTSMNVEDMNPIVDAFEKKYGIKVEYWRASSEKVSQRAITEFNAKRYDVDAFENGGPMLEALYREKMLEPFQSPYFKDLPEEAFPPHKHWVSTRFNFFVAAYNTNLVKGDQIPKTYDDLISPQWKGKFAIETGDTEWFATLVKYWGEQKGMDYFQKLAANQPQIREGHSLMSELVSSGEIPLALTAFNHEPERLKAKGAPVEWVPLEPVVAHPNGLALAKNAPHPHAALLFGDFLISFEGQELIFKRGRVPSSNKIDTKLNKFKYILTDPSATLDEWDKWDKEWNKLFVKKR